MKRPTHIRLTVQLPVEVVEAVRNAVIRLAGPPLRMTLAGLVAGALRREVARLQRTQHDGRPFPRRRRPLRIGRPRKP